MKANYSLVLIVIMMSAISCSKKENVVGPTGSSPSDYYSSMKEFYHKNEVKSQFFTVNASLGGSFTSAKGTKVIIPPYAFVYTMGGHDTVKSNVLVEFKDIYKKSDMLLSDKPTTALLWKIPIKSAGEFYIRVSVNNHSVEVHPQNVISVHQPALSSEIDWGMQAFIGGFIPGVAQPDTFGWNWDEFNFNVSVAIDTTTLSWYIFSLYNFAHFAEDSGSWSNSDNAYYFFSYPQTSLILEQSDTINYGSDVFLVFKDVNSMVHVYKNNTDNNYPYLYAPKGLQCTVVAVGLKNSQLYSAFVPVTITDSLIVNFSLNQTTTDEFKAKLTALN